MEDYKTQIHRCFRCGYCKYSTIPDEINCPSYARFRLESYSTGGRMWLINAWLTGEIEWSEHLGDVLYSCTTCKNCAQQCPQAFGKEVTDWIVKGRADMVEKQKVPPMVRRFLEGVYRDGNPLKALRVERGAWADGVKIYQPGDEYLLYVGCLGSYDEFGQGMAKAFASVLQLEGTSFGILGADEECCGNEVHQLGENDLFQMLAEKNIQKFKELGVKKVVTLCPHGYNAMKNYYPEFGADFEVYHYTQVLRDLVKKDKSKFPKPETKVKVTYHDPCYLGRHNQIFDEPRQALLGLPGIQLVEMKRNKENAFCCGGGSGNFATDAIKGGGQDSPARLRLRQAYETGAEVLAVACPACMTMFKDALKAEELEGKMAIKDIAQIVQEAMSA